MIDSIRNISRFGRRLRPESARSRHREEQFELETLAERPAISLVMPTYNTEFRYLREAIESVLAQHYPEWELCIADDGSTDQRVRRTIESYSDPRIRSVFLELNSGISAASNRALELCTGEFVGFLDHDDKLTPDALLRVAQALNADPDLDVVYTDQDKLTTDGRRADPFLKPDWSPVYALGAMYIGHLLVVRRSVAEAAGGFDSAFDKIQDFEFMLRVSERTSRIHHIPRILYHWRAIPGSIAAGADQKSGVPELQARAVSTHLERLDVNATAVPHPAIPHRVMLVPGDGMSRGKVSIVVPRRGEGIDRLLDSLFGLTAYQDFEVILVEGLWSPSEPISDRHPVETVRDPAPTFAPARVNNLGRERAGGEHLLFLREFVEIVEPDWIDQLLLHAGLPDVGAVGPLLVRSDGNVDQAGAAIALRDPTGPIMPGFPADGDGYYGSLPCAREVSAVSGACMLVGRTAFEELDGFNEFYSAQYEDFDLCQRLQARGWSVVYAPRPRVVSHQTPAARRTATDIIDRALFVDNWYDELRGGDPFFNPGFDRGQATYDPVGAGKQRPEIAPLPGSR